MSSFLVTANSSAITPQTQQVHLTEFYNDSGGTIGVALNSTVTTVYYQGGGQVANPQTSNNPYFTLIKGNYSVVVSPSYVSTSIGYIVSSGVTFNLEIPRASSNVPVYIPIKETHLVNVSLPNLLTGSSAKVSFTTTSGFTFLTNTTSKPYFYAYLPAGQFYASATYGGDKFTYLETQTGSQKTLSIPFSGQKSMYGFVSASDGSAISGLNIIAINTSSHNYSVTHFGGNSFTMTMNKGAYPYMAITLSVPGYAPENLKNAPGDQTPAPLVSSSSNIYFNYSLSRNLQKLNFSGVFKIGNSTTLPFLPNSSVGSLYWQMKLDSHFGNDLSTYAGELMQPFTNSSFTLNGYNYMRYGKTTVGVPTVGTNSASISFNATYNNSAVPEKYSGMTIKLYDRGTFSGPGTLGYNYNLSYDNSTLALQSSTVNAKTGSSPIIIGPQSTSQWITLKFASVKNPTFVNSYITLNWKGLNSTNYIVNKSQKNTIFVVPQNKLVTLNLSKAYFNPVTGTNDYQKATFAWSIKNSTGTYTNTGYNIQVNFHTAFNNSIQISSTSTSGGYNTTNITIYAVNVAPTVSFNVTLNGKIKYNLSNLANGAIQNINLLQSKSYLYSAYNSTAKISGTKYNVPMIYTWKFTNFTATSANVTHAFSKPTVKPGSYTSGTLNVTTVTGTTAIINIHVHVNDTTPANAKFTMKNSKGKAISNPQAGTTVTLTAAGTSDPYNQTLTYNWTIRYINGTVAQNGSIYHIVSGNMSSSIQILVNFTTLNDFKVSLNVTNHPANVSAYVNKTYTVVVSSPRIVITKVKFLSTPTKGDSNTMNITLTNKGTENAKSFNITVVGGGFNQTQFYNRSLNISQNATVHFTWTPQSSGNVSVVVSGNTYGEPTYFSKIGELTTYASVNPPSYETPLIIGIIVVVVVVVGFLYYRFSSRSMRRGRETESKEKTSMLAKRLEQQKQLEKKEKKE